jgi:hypothetical protein
MCFVAVLDVYTASIGILPYLDKGILPAFGAPRDQRRFHL